VPSINNIFYSFVYFVLINFNLSFCEFTISADRLIHHKRFDLMAKYIYAKHRELGVSQFFAEDLYKSHLIAMMGGEDKVQEAYPVKKGCKEYLESFNRLLDDIKNNGYNSDKSSKCHVWCKKLKDNKNSLSSKFFCDGAHRVAASLLYNKKVFVSKEVEVNKLPPYDYDFFKKNGLSQKYLNAMCLEYCKLNKNIFLLIVFPSSKYKNLEIKRYLNTLGVIIADKYIYLRKRGQINLLDQVYKDKNWGCYTPKIFNERNNRFKKVNNAKMQVYLLEPKEVNLINRQILRKFGFDNVFLSKNHLETVEMAKLLFNENSINLLNNKRRNHKFNNLKTLIKLYKWWLKSANLKSENFCIDGSGALAAYGLRDSNDLDLLHKGFTKEVEALDDTVIGSSHCNLKYHDYNKNKIIFNPDNYFYYNGLKFVSLDVLKKFKQNRKSEPSDFEDLELISCVNKGVN